MKVLKSKEHGCSMEMSGERVVDFDGTYKLVKTIDYENFTTIFEGFGPEVMLDPHYKFSLECHGNKWKSIDYIQGYPPVVTNCTLGEECVFPIDSKFCALFCQVLCTYEMFRKRLNVGGQGGSKPIQNGNEAFQWSHSRVVSCSLHGANGDGKNLFFI